MGKILRISLKLNISPNTLGCYGLSDIVLKYSCKVHANGFLVMDTSTRDILTMFPFYVGEYFYERIPVPVSRQE